jgi:glycosyltransferase involved in cell wall biosynthesis
VVFYGGDTVRVLLLIDHPTHPDAQRYLDFVQHNLDSERIQLHVCSLRSGSELAHYSLDARSNRDLKAFRRLRQLIKTLDIELIHVLDTAPIMLAAGAAFLAQLPLLVTFYEIHGQRKNWFQWTGFRWYWALLGRVITRAIVPTEVIKRQLWLITNYDRERIDVFYPPHDVPAEEPLDRAAYELPAGPLVTVLTPEYPDDGYDMIFDAVPRLMHRVPDVTFVFAGARAIITDWQRKMARIRPAAPIRWVVDPPSLIPYVMLSDLVVAHPHHEGWVESLVIAALCAKPVVAARIGGVTEIVDTTVTGLLITPDDVRDLALQATRLLSQPEFAVRLGKQAKARIMDMLSPEKCRDTLMTTYEATIYSTR